MTLVLVVALPFACAAVLAMLGRRSGRRLAGAILVGSLTIAFGAALAIAQAFAAGKTVLLAELGPWLPLRGADLTLRIDPAMVPLVAAFTGIAALTALFGVVTLGPDGDPVRFDAAFALTVGGALLVMVASNLMLIFAGWELVAAGTYLLVSHRRDRPEASAAGLRSFVVARVGDTGLLVAALSLLATFRSTDLDEIAQHIGGFAPGTDTATGAGAVLVPSLLVLVAALVRSTQLPFHVWLPDVAEAPAAASAVIQTTAAAGGVVLLVRLAPILDPTVLTAAAAIGALSATVGALVSLAQADPRRLVAWSTVSQLGLAFVAAGSGAPTAALFTLLAHAVTKAAVVLSIGARGTRLGAVAFASGVIFLAAVPAASYLAVIAVASGVGARPDVAPVFLVTTILTAMYVWRVLIRTRVPALLAEAARSGSRMDALYRRAIVASFGAAAQVLDRGSERVLAQSATVLGATAARAGELASAAHHRYAPAREAIVLAAALALVAYWTLR